MIPSHFIKFPSQFNHFIIYSITHVSIFMFWVHVRVSNFPSLRFQCISGLGFVLNICFALIKFQVHVEVKFLFLKWD